MSNDDVCADEEYLSLLREASGTVPLSGADWDALYARVDAAAELPLARRRRGSAVPGRHAAEGAWWEYAARRGRAAIPLAVAASLAFVAYARAHPIDETTTAIASVADVRDAFEATVTDGGSSGQVAILLVSSPTDADSAASDVTP